MCACTFVPVRHNTKERKFEYDATRAFLAYAGDSSSIRLCLHWTATSPRPALVRYDDDDAFPPSAAEWDSSSSALHPAFSHLCRHKAVKALVMSLR